MPLLDSPANGPKSIRRTAGSFTKLPGKCMGPLEFASLEIILLEGKCSENKEESRFWQTSSG